MADAKQQLQAAAATAGVWKTVKPFVNGGASGMLATCVIQPIDMVKVDTRHAPRPFFVASRLLIVSWGGEIGSVRTVVGRRRYVEMVYTWCVS
jgi:hypothetical protein